MSGNYSTYPNQNLGLNCHLRCFSHVNVGSAQWPLHWAQGFLPSTIEDHVVKIVISHGQYARMKTITLDWSIAQYSRLFPSVKGSDNWCRLILTSFVFVELFVKANTCKTYHLSCWNFSSIISISRRNTGISDDITVEEIWAAVVPLWPVTNNSCSCL